MRSGRSLRSVLAGAGVVVAVIAAALFGVAGPASAHVTVSSASAVQGGYAKVTFRVPNEKATAGTVKLEVTFPEDAPIPSASIKPVPGWRAEIEKRTLSTPITVHGASVTEGVAKVTWTANPGTAIEPGQFQEFDVSVGPLPSVDQLILKALQTYSDGDIVRWIDEPTPGVEVEHPAPILALSAPGGTDGSATDDEGDGFGVALAFGITGTVVGLAALALALLGRRSSKA